MEIIPGIHLVDGVRGNVYLGVGDDGLMLVDSGIPGSAGKILDYVKNELKRKPSDVKTIVVTHHHIDHVGSLLALKKATNAKVAVYSEEADYLARRKKQNIKVKGLRPTLYRILRMLLRSGAVKPDILLKENDTIEGYVVVHTPGHTSGSIALYDPAKKVIFVGDTIRNDKGVLGESPQHFSQDPKEARQSIEKISKLDFEVMLPGHGTPLKNAAAEKVREFYRNLR